MEDQKQVSELESAQVTPETLFQKVCNVCKEENLIKQTYLATCGKCGEVYCVHFASTVDPSFCTGCCSDIVMTDQTIYKKTEHYNEETDKVYTKSSRARQIQFSGLDWLFYQRQIDRLTDTELALAIEYHRAIYNSMMFERDQRRAEYAHRNANKIIIPTSKSSVTEVTTTKVKKTRTVKASSPTQAAANVAALLEVLVKQGKSKEEILAMLGVKK